MKRIPTYNPKPEARLGPYVVSHKEPFSRRYRSFGLGGFYEWPSDGGAAPGSGALRLSRMSAVSFEVSPLIDSTEACNTSGCLMFSHAR